MNKPVAYVPKVGDPVVYEPPEFTPPVEPQPLRFVEAIHPDGSLTTRRRGGYGTFGAAGNCFRAPTSAERASAGLPAAGRPTYVKVTGRVEGVPQGEDRFVIDWSVEGAPMVRTDSGRVVTLIPGQWEPAPAPAGFDDVAAVEEWENRLAEGGYCCSRDQERLARSIVAGIRAATTALRGEVERVTKERDDQRRISEQLERDVDRLTWERGEWERRAAQAESALTAERERVRSVRENVRALVDYFTLGPVLFQTSNRFPFARECVKGMCAALGETWPDDSPAPASADLASLRADLAHLLGTTHEPGHPGGTAIVNALDAYLGAKEV